MTITHETTAKVQIELAVDEVLELERPVRGARPAKAIFPIGLDGDGTAQVSNDGTNWTALTIGTDSPFAQGHASRYFRVNDGTGTQTVTFLYV